MLGNTLRLNFCYLKTIQILHLRYHPQIVGHILKNKQKSKYVCIHEINTINDNENEDENQKRSHRYDINRPRLRHRLKHSKCKKCLRMMMLICIKQHLSNT